MQQRSEHRFVLPGGVPTEGGGSGSRLDGTVTFFLFPGGTRGVAGRTRSTNYIELAAFCSSMHGRSPRTPPTSSCPTSSDVCSSVFERRMLRFPSLNKICIAGPWEWYSCGT